MTFTFAMEGRLESSIAWEALKKVDREFGGAILNVSGVGKTTVREFTGLEEALRRIEEMEK